jgi:hypothetical protein
MNKEKLIIAKLLKIAQNQQKLITRLAQAQDTNVEYLRRVAVIAGTNIGATVTESTVVPMQSSTTDNVSIPTGYVLSVLGVPVQLRQKYIDTVKSQVKAQKPEQPELADNLTINFRD